MECKVQNQSKFHTNYRLARQFNLNKLSIASKNIDWRTKLKIWTDLNIFTSNETIAWNHKTGKSYTKHMTMSDLKILQEVQAIGT